MEYLTKLKPYLIKYKKWIIAFAILIVAGIGANTVIQYHNNKVIDYMHIKFVGYNGHGYIEQKDEAFQKYVTTRLLKKNHVDKDAIKQFIDDSSNFDPAAFSDEDASKIEKTITEMNDIETTMSKSSNLKNGDKITLKVINHDKKNVPIREGKKVFTVKGLKKAKSVSTDKVFDKLDVKTVGVNGKGFVSIKTEDDDLYNRDFTIKNNHKLKNGDKFTITLPDKFFKDPEGKKTYTGKHSHTYTASGLVDKVTNLDVVKSQIKKIEEERHADPITLNIKNIYLLSYVQKVDAADDDFLPDFGDKPEIVNSGLNHHEPLYSVIAVVKVNSDDGLDVDDIQVRFDEVKIKDNKIDKSTIEDSDFGTATDFDDENATLKKISNLGIKLQ